MNGEQQKVTYAMAGLVIIECVALFNGIDGTLMAVVIAAIAGLGGYSLAKIKPE